MLKISCEKQPSKVSQWLCHASKIWDLLKPFPVKMYFIRWNKVWVVLLLIYPVLTYILFFCDHLTNIHEMGFSPLSMSLNHLIVGATSTLATLPMGGAFLNLKVMKIIKNSKKKSVIRVVAVHIVIVGFIYWIAYKLLHSYEVAAGGVIGITAIIGFGRALVACKSYVYILCRYNIEQMKIAYIRYERGNKIKKRIKKIFRERRELSKINVASFS